MEINVSWAYQVRTTHPYRNGFRHPDFSKMLESQGVRTTHPYRNGFRHATSGDGQFPAGQNDSSVQERI